MVFVPHRLAYFTNFFYTITSMFFSYKYKKNGKSNKNTGF